MGESLIIVVCVVVLLLCVVVLILELTTDSTGGLVVDRFGELLHDGQLLGSGVAADDAGVSGGESAEKGVVLIFIVVVDGEQLLGGFMLLMALCMVSWIYEMSEAEARMIASFFVPSVRSQFEFKLWRERSF